MGMICKVFIVTPQTATQLVANPADLNDVLASLDSTDHVLSLEKSWHGLHFVLTGTAWQGSPPLNILAGGGTAIGSEDLDFVPARMLDPSGVSELHAALSAFSQEDFMRNFDPVALSEANVYPTIWDEPPASLIAEYNLYLNALKAHVQRAAEAGQALLVFLG